MRLYFISLVVAILAPFATTAQIKAGPMLGFVDMMEAKIWLQTEAPASVKVVYWKSEEPEIVYGSETINTHTKNAFVATFTIAPLEPGLTYGYELWVNEEKVDFSYPLLFTTQPIWKWRGDAPDFSFVFGSCFYVNEPAYDRPGKPYGQNFGILEEIRSQGANFMIWGGDNMYYRETDWNSSTGMYHRFTHTRSLEELQPLLAAMPHFATWDDHDYGPNDSDRSFWMKRQALEVFKDFWPNPNYIFEKDGVTGSFIWGDCQFFLLDDRWWRSPNKRTKSGDQDYFGEEQLNWLIDALSYSDATFKFIVTGGQVVNPYPVGENYSNYAEERSYLFSWIEKEGIEGVVFLTGDRHHTCLQELVRPGTYPLYDLTISPLTSGAGKPKKTELNAPYVEGTVVEKTQNFAKLSITGPNDTRVLHIQVFDYQGKPLWEKSIPANTLK